MIEYNRWDRLKTQSSRCTKNISSSFVIFTDPRGLSRLIRKTKLEVTVWVLVWGKSDWFNGPQNSIFRVMVRLNDGNLRMTVVPNHSASSINYRTLALLYEEKDWPRFTPLSSRVLVGNLTKYFWYMDTV